MARKGSSGGPNFLADPEGDMLLDENGQPISIAVNSHGAQGYNSGKTSISSDFFDAVDVLEREEICIPEGRVTAESGLNRREGPGTEFYKVRPDADGTPSALPYGSTVAMGEEVDGWRMVIGEDGRPGFSSSEHIEPTGECIEEDSSPNAVEGDFTGPDADAGGDTQLLIEARETGLGNPVPSGDSAGYSYAHPAANASHSFGG